MSYPFGNILMITERDLWVIVFLDAVIVMVGLLFYNKLLAVCFDEEFARLRGVHSNFFYLLLLCLTALTIILLVRIVGIVMVIALLTLPAAAASHFVGRLWQMMALSTILCLIYITGGMAISYGPDLPSGPVIVTLAGAVYLFVIVVKTGWSFFKTGS